MRCLGARIQGLIERHLIGLQQVSRALRLLLVDLVRLLLRLGGMEVISARRLAFL